jgi:hypothetical protein
LPLHPRGGSYCDGLMTLVFPPLANSTGVLHVLHEISGRNRVPVVPLEVGIASRDGGRGERGGSYHECRVESRDTTPMPPILPIKREWRELVLEACGAPTPLSLP